MQGEDLAGAEWESPWSGQVMRTSCCTHACMMLEGHKQAWQAFEKATWLHRWWLTRVRAMCECNQPVRGPWGPYQGCPIPMQASLLLPSPQQEPASAHQLVLTPIASFSGQQAATVLPQQKAAQISRGWASRRLGCSSLIAHAAPPALSPLSRCLLPLASKARQQFAWHGHSHGPRNSLLFSKRQL